MISTAYAAAPGMFWGKVTNKNTGAAIPGPQMAFNGPSNATVNRNTDGSYVSPNLNPGTYTITVTATGYQTITNTGVNLPEGGYVQKNYKMTPLQGLQAGSEASVENDNASTQELPENAIQMLEDIKDQILSLDPAMFKTPERQDALVKKYDTVIRNIQEGRYDLALRKLQYGILIKINGCNRLGQSDDNDWIIVCEAQRPVYDDTEEAREIIKKELILSITSCCISGYVKEWDPASGTYKGVGGASVSLSGGRGSATTASNGYYAMFPACGTYNVTAKLPAPDGRSQQKSATLGCPGVNFNFSYQP